MSVRRKGGRYRVRRRRRSGFTLMEVLLVLAILVILGSIVVANFSGVFSKAKVKAAKTQISELDKLVQMYMLDIGQAPPTDPGLEALRQPPPGLPDPSKWGPEPYTNKPIPLDPWGNKYVYENINGTSYKITSPGPDGRLGTEDDISNQ